MEPTATALIPELPEAFVDLVRDALLHLYDPAQLQSHPLLSQVPGDAVASGMGRGRLLRQALLDAIEALQPERGVAATSRAWRAYRILDLRYLEALEVSDVIGRVALSKSQYHREHQRALHGVAGVLWERWRLAARWVEGAPGRPGRQVAEMLARGEAEQLREGQAGRIEPLEVVRGAIRVIRPLCVARGIDVEVSGPEQAPLLRGDRVALRQALLTILGHAASVVETGVAGPISTVPRPVVTVTAEIEPGRLVLTLSGPGGPDFTPARLGMIESAPFVDALDGTARFQPATGLAQRWAIELSFPAEEPPLLLVVDNNDDFRQLVQRFLVGHGWVMVGAASVDEAYALACRQHPMAILLDVVIPGRDGWELLLDLKQAPATRDIPVIVCSVLDEPAVAISLGAAGYLQKPINQHGLLAALEPLVKPPTAGPLALA